MAEVKVLVKGEHKRTEDGKLRIYSSVSLIKTDKNIIVDTGSFHETELIIKGLKEENLTPEDMDIVFLTHLHLDHVINTHLFKNAKIYCKFNPGYPGQIHNPKDGTIERTEINDGVKLTKDVEFLLTPGHTTDSTSLIVTTQDGKVCIAGDAFPSKEFLNLNKEPLAMLVDISQFNKSRDKILAIADYIIPGHGDIFKV
jgi:glyoxylase-like metal-dependent hydrolase (beta-lactamase superfamily II)